MNIRNHGERLTPADFEETIPHLPRMQPRSIALTRRVLVDGESMSAIAREAGIARQAVQTWTKRFTTAYRRHVISMPETWKCRTYCLPQIEIRKLAKYANELHEEAIARAAKNGKKITKNGALAERSKAH